jgi:hypothetical protein
VATPVQEARWVLRAQCGDREALELLLTAIRPSLARYVRGLVGPSDAEDLLQDILLIVYRKLKLLQQPEVFRAWVFRVASRAAFRYLKKRNRWPKEHVMSANAEDTLRKHLDAVDRMERKSKITTAFAGVVAVFTYGSFFYLSGTADIRLVLVFAVASLSIGTALAANALHLRVAQMVNRILKAIELSLRQQE